MKDNSYSSKSDEDMINNKFKELQKLKEKLSDEEWHEAMYKFGYKYKRF